MRFPGSLLLWHFVSEARSQIAPATDRTFTVRGVSVDVDGQGSSKVDGVTLARDSGSARFLGANYRTVAYVAQPSWGGYDLFDALAVREDGGDIALLYLYCSPAGSPSEGLSSIYYEAFETPMRDEQASGSCAFSLSDASVRASFPAITTVPSAGKVTSFALTGDATLDSSGVGSLQGRDGVTRTFTPFQIVDCTDCPGGPWYELHSIFDSRPDDACFGIVYLFPNDRQRMSLQYSLCFPSMASIDAELRGSWSGGPAANAPERVARPRPDLPWRQPLASNHSSRASVWVTV